MHSLHNLQSIHCDATIQYNRWDLLLDSRHSNGRNTSFLLSWVVYKQYKRRSVSLAWWQNIDHNHKQEAFEKCWAHSPLRAAACPFTRCRYWRTPAIAIAQAACDVHDNNDNDNAWQRGPLWPHRMGPKNLVSSPFKIQSTNWAKRG